MRMTNFLIINRFIDKVYFFSSKFNIKNGSYYGINVIGININITSLQKRRFTNIILTANQINPFKPRRFKILKAFIQYRLKNARSCHESYHQ